MTDGLEIEERIRLAIKIGESHYREFKSAWDGPENAKRPGDLKEILRNVGKTLVAFANGDGGELLLGVEDDGTISGVPHRPQEVTAILNADTTHVHPDTPLPPPRKRAVSIDECTVIYFSISKGSQYVYLTSDGKSLRRSDRETVPIGTEKVVAQRLEDQGRVWDREPAFGASLNDLDINLVEGVAGQIAYGISVEKCLQYLDLADFTLEGLRLKRAALLMFAKDIRRWHAGCLVRTMVVQGTEKLAGEAFNIRRDEIVAGNILQLIDTAWERLNYALSTHTNLTEAARFQTAFLYPQSAVREALINAIVHRNYAIEGRGIEISVFQDRMEIFSPGMLLSTISLEDIKKLKGVHESRNPLIARVLREVGLVREMGEGMQRIFSVMKSSSLAEPAIENDTTGFKVTLYNKSMYEPNVRLWLTAFEKYDLSQNSLAVLALGYGGREFSTQDIIDRLGIVDIDQVQQTVTPLRKQGLLERTKSHAQAYKYAEINRVPKREVPTYGVIDPSAKPAAPPADVEVIIEEEPAKIHKLYLSNLAYSLTREQIVLWLSETCDVRGLQMPSGMHYGSVNRGYAFAIVAYDGSLRDLVAALDGTFLGYRRAHVAPYREN